MEFNYRLFQLDTEWNVLHMPDRPNGFGVLVLGEKNHFVDENSSFWIQNAGRLQMISGLKRAGYTIFYSNLYGRNWGSPKAVTLAKRLYHIVMKSEILNERIHILAEGMGALVALQLMEEMTEKIRSVAMIDPCVDLKAHLKHEKEHKFFYKLLKKELIAAYSLNDSEVENVIIAQKRIDELRSTLPVKIWQTTDRPTYPPQLHSRKYEELRDAKNSPISLTLHLAEKRYSFSSSISNFYRQNEKFL